MVRRVNKLNNEAATLHNKKSEEGRKIWCHNQILTNKQMWPNGHYKKDIIHTSGLKFA